MLRMRPFLCLQRGRCYIQSSSSGSNSSNSSSSSSSLSTAFEEIAKTRQYTWSFDAKRPIPPPLLTKLLEVSQTAPSSFNLQPFKVIAVRGTDAKAALSASMLGPGNGQRVRDAPVTIVYISDKEPMRLTRQLMAIETAGGADASYVNSLPAILGSLFGNNGFISTRIRRLVTHMASPLAPAPVIPTDLTAWAIKNTIFSAQTFMLACAAEGVATAPMEGFDERRLCFALGVPPERYSIPLVVAVGYPKGTSAAVRPKKRYALQDICFSDRYGEKYN